jgi:hypothetical protein
MKETQNQSLKRTVVWLTKSENSHLIFHKHSIGESNPALARDRRGY